VSISRATRLSGYSAQGGKQRQSFWHAKARRRNSRTLRSSTRFVRRPQGVPKGGARGSTHRVQQVSLPGVRRVAIRRFTTRTWREVNSSGPKLPIKRNEETPLQARAAHLVVRRAARACFCAPLIALKQQPHGRRCLENPSNRRALPEARSPAGKRNQLNPCRARAFSQEQQLAYQLGSTDQELFYELRMRTPPRCPRALSTVGRFQKGHAAPPRASRQRTCGALPDARSSCTTKQEVQVLSASRRGRFASPPTKVNPAECHERRREECQ
jgi:hypothetical protein